jgi:hypothetical protein
MENLENKMNNSHRKMSPYRRHSWMGTRGRGGPADGAAGTGAIGSAGT